MALVILKVPMHRMQILLLRNLYTYMHRGKKTDERKKYVIAVGTKHGTGRGFNLGFVGGASIMSVRRRLLLPTCSTANKMFHLHALALQQSCASPLHDSDSIIYHFL